MRDTRRPQESMDHQIHRETGIKRGQFTRSLSNTDAPSDEKAGKYDSLLYCFNIIV